MGRKTAPLLLLSLLSPTIPASPRVAWDGCSLDDVVEHGDWHEQREADRRPAPRAAAPRSVPRRLSSIRGLVGRYLREGYAISDNADGRMSHWGVKVEEVESILESGSFERAPAEGENVYVFWGKLPDGLDVGVSVSLRDETMEVIKVRLHGSRWGVNSRIVGHIEAGSYRTEISAEYRLRRHGIGFEDILFILRNSKVQKRTEENTYVVWGRLSDGLEVGVSVSLAGREMGILSVMVRGDRQGLLVRIREHVAGGRYTFSHRLVRSMASQKVDRSDALRMLQNGRVASGPEGSYVVRGRLSDGRQAGFTIVFEDGSLRIDSITFR